MLNDLPESITSESVQNERRNEENERSMRLEKKKQNSRLSRMNETEEQRQIRLEKVRERSRSIRTNETEEERQNRLKDKRERSRSSRTNETEEERRNRLEDDGERHRSSRMNETEEQRQNRLQEERERSRSSRLNEAEEQRQNRLEQQRKLSKTNRLKKKFEKRSYETIDIETGFSIGQTWPEPIARELKEARLQRFLEQMSMSTLAEVTCAVCNVRTPGKDSKTTPVRQIPNISLLKVSEELKDFINKHSNEGTEISGNNSAGKTTEHTESN